MSLVRMVYASRPFGFDAGNLIDILFKSRANNTAADVTGCLICRDDLYLQWLEGPEANVNAIFAKIRADDRHVEITELLQEAATERLFGEWAMRDDPVQSWMWTRSQVDRGDVAKATPQEVLHIFNRMAQMAPEQT